MNAAKPYAKAAFRVNRPQDLGIALARAIGSQYRVALASLS